jgi:hypothetical protein
MRTAENENHSQHAFMRFAAYATAVVAHITMPLLPVCQ